MDAWVDTELDRVERTAVVGTNADECDVESTSCIGVHTSGLCLSVPNVPHSDSPILAVFSISIPCPIPSLPVDDRCEYGAMRC